MKYFFESAVKCDVFDKAHTTHLAIAKDGKIRYLISNDSLLRNRARSVLVNNISSYSKKLDLLMGALNIVPDSVWELARLGKAVSIKLPEEIEKAMSEVAEERWSTKKWGYNIIVGNYVEKQKIVLQCFTENKSDASIYFKICSDNARVEIENETNYLRAPIQSSYFENPKLCYSRLQKDGAQFNIQGTEEFTGKKVAPEMTPEIYQLYQEIAGFKKQKTSDGEWICFSHGDFVPWNLKCTENGYVVFDWEYCGMRFYGFDLIHYLWQIHNKLMGQNEKDAIKESIHIAKSYDKYLRSLSDKYIEERYFIELKKQFGEVL